jgi:type VI secretion system Hcp family effector
MSGRVYLKLKIAGADVAGESTVASIGGIDVSAAIECEGYEEGVSTAQDPTSRRAIGARIYTPLTIRKWVDKSSPLIAQALCETQEVEGEFLFFRPAPQGKQSEHFFKVAIVRGRVSAIKRFLPKPDQSGGDIAAIGKPPLEEVSFVFGSVTWTHVIGGTEHQDDWQQQS